MRRLENKVAIISGAGQGIGEEIARRFATEGAQIVIAGLSEESALRVAMEIGEKRGEAIAVKADVMSIPSIENSVQAAVRKFAKWIFWSTVPAFSCRRIC